MAMVYCVSWAESCLVDRQKLDQIGMQHGSLRNKTKQKTILIVRSVRFSVTFFSVSSRALCVCVCVNDFIWFLIFF